MGLLPEIIIGDGIRSFAFEVATIPCMAALGVGKTVLSNWLQCAIIGSDGGAGVCRSLNVLLQVATNGIIILIETRLCGIAVLGTIK